jgi:hypothetical protein
MNSVLVLFRMKTLKLSKSREEQIFEANECVSLGVENISGNGFDWEVLILGGCLWLSFESPLGKHSITPLIDVVLRAGQSYKLPASALERGIVVSTFEKSSVRFCQSIQVTS